KPEAPARCLAQIRARHHAVPATVESLPGDRARVVFDEPQSAVTPGQIVTVYQDDLVLGGGWIDRGIDQAPERRAASDWPQLGVSAEADIGGMEILEEARIVPKPGDPSW